MQYDTPIINAPTVTQPTCAIPTGTIVINATGSGVFRNIVLTGQPGKPSIHSAVLLRVTIIFQYVFKAVPHV